MLAILRQLNTSSRVTKGRANINYDINIYRFDIEYYSVHLTFCKICQPVATHFIRMKISISFLATRFSYRFHIMFWYVHFKNCTPRASFVSIVSSGLFSIYTQVD